MTCFGFDLKRTRTSGSDQTLGTRDDRLGASRRMKVTQAAPQLDPGLIVYHNNSGSEYEPALEQCQLALVGCCPGPRTRWQRRHAPLERFGDFHSETLPSHHPAAIGGVAQRGDEGSLEWRPEAQAVFLLPVRRVAAERPVKRVVGEK